MQDANLGWWVVVQCLQRTDTSKGERDALGVPQIVPRGQERLSITRETQDCFLALGMKSSLPVIASGPPLEP